jgi:ATP-dependent helicase/nuclease subunit A
MSYTTLPIDQDQRQRALDTNASFAVSAPAGSGKTGLLTQRVLALLAQCEEPENVLAITFTKKAAREMQTRILDALRDAEKNTTEPEADYLKTTWHLARAVLARNTEKKWELFNCPNRLRVTTIDSLCRSISQQMPFESKLGHTPEILDNPTLAYQIAARETLNQLNNAGDLQTHLIRLIKHFDNKLEKIETLFIQLLAKRDQWLGLIFQTKNQRGLLEAMLVEVIEEQLLNTQYILTPISSELAMLADHAARHLPNSTSPINACLGLTDLPSATIQSIPQWRGLAELLLTQKGELRKSVSKTIGFFAPSDKSLSKEQQAEAKIAKQRITELLEICKTVNELENGLDTVRTLPAPHYEEKQWQLLDSLTHVLIHLAQNLTLAFQQLGKTDYLAVTLAALDALGEPDSPSDLALALDYKIQHILVDEFQDTSTTQLTLLQRLIAGWQVDDGRTLFVVGDAMQSCYRFRDANVGIFLNVREQGIGDIALEPLDLQVNFRSQQGIVDWVNQSFNAIFPNHDDSNRGAVSYSPSTSVKAPLDLPAVQTHLLAYSDTLPSPRKEEARSVVQLIQENLHARPDDSIALLIKSRAHAQEIIYALNKANIDYQATDIDRLDNCMPVLDCLSLTKALLHPNDRLAWLAVLRAPWCGIDMYDLLAIAGHNTNGHDSKNTAENTSEKQDWPLIIKAISADGLHEKITALSPAGKKKLQRFSKVISQALSQQKRLSLRRWIQGIWLTLGGSGLLINPSDEENINTFFSLLDRYEQGGSIRQWNDLETAVNHLYAKPAINKHTHNSNPVQIMTIHKSKGLEFDTVIIPALDKGTKNNDKELLLWLERVTYSHKSHQQERQLLISPVNATGEGDDPIYDFIRAQHTEKEQLEAERVLYVGCTRAIKQLHLLAYVGIDEKIENTNNTLTIDGIKTPSKKTLLHRLWPSIQHSDPKHCHIIACENTVYKENTHKKLNHPNVIASVVKDWQAPKTCANTLLSAYRGSNIFAKIKTDNINIQEEFFAEEKKENTKENTKENNKDMRENIAPSDTLLQREQRYIGTVIHLALQHITETGYKHWTSQRIQQQYPIWKTQLAQHGISPLGVDKALNTVSQAIHNTLKDKTGQWLLDNTHTKSATELELWNETGQHIIDRTFIEEKDGDKIRWVVDYKSSQAKSDQAIDEFIDEHKQQYQTQLQRYAHLFKDEKITVKTALYFPLMQILVTL